MHENYTMLYLKFIYYNVVTIKKNSRLDDGIYVNKLHFNELVKKIYEL